MDRFAYNQLLKWKQSDNSNILLIGGVNGVGKTFIVRKFADNEFDKSYYFDFKENKDLNSINFNDFKSNSLIIIDNLIGNKDLLEFFTIKSEEFINLKLILIDPYAKVGKGSNRTIRVNYLVFYPLSFEEFLYNVNYKIYNELINLKNVFNISDNLHGRLLKYYQEYLIVGGMPEVVSYYKEFGLDFDKIREIQKSILENIYSNLNYFFKKNEYKNFLKIINLIFTTLTRDNKKFKLTDISSSIRSITFNNYFEILKKLNLIYISKQIKGEEFIVDNKSMILYFFDVGILGLLGEVPEVLYNSENLYKNQITLGLSLNFVSTELFSTIQLDIYNWVHNMAKIEFLLKRGETYHPIEVKDDSSGKLKSLSVFLDLKNMPKVSRLNSLKPDIKGVITTYPIYLVKSLYRKFIS